MKLSSNPSSGVTSPVGRRRLGLFAALLACATAFIALAQTAQKDSEPKAAASTNAPAPAVTPGASANPAGTSDSKITTATETTGSSTNKEAATNAVDSASSTNEIQVSFQGANIDMIVEWLAKNTGKSVVKSAQAQCQLTIVSSKKITPREAISLIYRALSMEGIAVVESSKFIFIVPEGKEPKMNPELIEVTRTNIPVGRQRLIKMFPLKHVQAAEMKERVKGLLSEKATVEVDAHANQIIVTDFNDNLALVGDIIGALDTDQPGDVAVRMIPLKHVSAQELVKEISPLYQKLTSKSQKEMVEISANDRSNSLIILSGESDFKAIERLVMMLDTEDAQEKATQTFQLKNADATDVAKQLKDLNQDQDSSSRYPYYIFGGSGGQSSKAQKKFSVVADRRRNTIIVQATPSLMDGISKMIAALDEPVTDESLSPKIIQLKYVSAVDMEEVLNELFLKKKEQQRPYWYYDEEPRETPDRDVGRLYGKVRITSEPHANALILTSNSKENLEAVEAILEQLDVPSAGGESTLRVELQFAKAFVVANSVNILFAKNGSPPLRPVNQPNQTGLPNQPQQQQTINTSRTGFDLGEEVKEDGYFPWLGGQPDNPRSGDGRATRPVSDLVGRVRAVADLRGNALMVSANIHFLPQVLKLIQELDAPTDQVLIEARLVEVASDFLEKLGVRWSPDGSKVFSADDFDNSILATATAHYQQGFGGNTTVNTPASPTMVAQGLASLRSGVLSSTINMDFLIQFLQKTTEASVLAEPQLNIRDNETGRLFVGQQVPVPDNTQISSVGSQNTTIRYRDVGVVLEVTPHINSSGDVELRIHTESSTVVPGQNVLGGAVFDTRNFRTDLTAKNGQTLILGGIIQRLVIDTLRKTPILGDIPGLKWMFNKKDTTTRQVELMVFLRPRVVRSPQEAGDLLRSMDEKFPLVKKWREGIPPETKGKEHKKTSDD